MQMALLSGERESAAGVAGGFGVTAGRTLEALVDRKSKGSGCKEWD